MHITKIYFFYDFDQICFRIRDHVLQTKQNSVLYINICGLSKALTSGELFSEDDHKVKKSELDVKCNELFSSLFQNSSLKINWELNSPQDFQTHTLLKKEVLSLEWLKNNCGYKKISSLTDLP
jgi:hypothetical protein